LNVMRGPAVLVLAALVATAVAIGPSGQSSGGSRPVAMANSAVPLDGEATTLWFCAGPTSEVAGIDQRRIEVVGLSGNPVEGRVTVVDDGRRAIERDFRIDAGRRLEVEPDRLVPGASFAAVTVEVSGGAALVFQAVEGPDGTDRRPCPTRTDVTWLVPWSTTARPGNSAWLLLHNPFRAAAVADLRFVGDIGRRETLDSQGVVVPGRSVVAYDLTERIADSSVVSATVDVRVGRVVTMRLQISDGSGPKSLRGLDLAPGVARTSEAWLLPGVGSTDAAGLMALSVLNPGAKPVEVEVVPRFADPSTFVEPWQLVLRSGQRYMVDLSDGRLDGRGEFGLEVRSLDMGSFGKDGVAASVVRWSDDGSAGLDVRPASAVAARGWVIDLPARFGATDDVLAVSNPSGAGIATVEVKVLAGLPPGNLPIKAEVPPGGQLGVPLGGGGPVVLAVESTSPVVTSVRYDSPDGWSAFSAVAIAGTTEALVRPVAN